MPRTTVEQLRDDIDAGRTGDKVAVLDPAAAPLGADEEAAGSPPPARAIEHAARQERARGAAVQAAHRDARHDSLRLVLLAVLLGSALVGVAVWLGVH